MTGRELAALSGQESIVVIRRPFVHWLGNIGRALLVDQLLFESNARDGGEFTRTDAEWQNTLLLSRREIRDARDHLIGLGVLDASSRGMPRRMWYKLDADKAAKLFSAFIAERGASTLEWPNGRSRLAKRPSKSGQMGGHSIQGGEGVFEGTDSGATEAPGATDPPPATRKPAPRKPRQPKEPAAPDRLIETIATDLTGRAQVEPGKRGLIYPIASDLRELVGSGDIAGIMAWLSFKDALEAKKEWRFVRPHTARDYLGRWAANGGAAELADIRREYGQAVQS